MNDAELHLLCQRWALWCRQQGLMGVVPLETCEMAKLPTRRRPLPSERVPFTTTIAAFHLAVMNEPADALDRRVFELHYLWRVRQIKIAAPSMGIVRQHWYRLVRNFRWRVFRNAQRLLRAEETKFRWSVRGNCAKNLALPVSARAPADDLDLTKPRKSRRRHPAGARHPRARDPVCG